MQFTVTKEFRDKYTDEHYVPGVIFVSDEKERIADLQQRGLIGEEIPQPTKKESATATEEATADKGVKRSARQNKNIAENKE